MAKVIFRNSDFRKYRIPFYDELCNLHDVKFVFRFNKVPNKYKFIAVEKGKSSFWTDKKFLFNYGKWLFGDFDVFIATVPTHSISVIGIFIAKLRGKKVIIWVEGWLQPSKRGFKKRIKYYLHKFILKVPDVYFVTGSKAERFVQSFVQKKNLIIFKVLQANIDMKKFIPQKPNITLPRNHFVFLYFGRIIELKGLNFLLEAFKKVNGKYQDTTLCVVGEGYFKKHCESLVKEHQIPNVIFYPSIDDNENELKVGLYNLCDIFVLPSTITNNQSEGWGLTVGEAMSLSKPVIVTDAVGCTDDLVKNGINGFKIKHGSIDQLVTAMLQSIEMKSSLSEMGKSGRIIFKEKISSEMMAKKLSHAISHLISNEI